MTVKDKFISDSMEAERDFESAVEAESKIPDTERITDIKKIPKGDKFPNGDLFSEKTVWKVWHTGNKKLSFMNGLGVDSLLSNRGDIRKQLWKGDISECSIQNINADTTYRIKFEYHEDVI